MTMYAAVIDTLRFADRLKAAGFNDPQAEGMARALGDELPESMVTKRDLDDAVQSLRATIETMDAKFESRFESFEGKFESRFQPVEDKFESRFESFEGKFESRFESIDSKFESMSASFESRFEAVDARFEAVDARFEAVDARFEAIDARLESQHREFSGKFNVLFGTMALGFTLVIGLLGYSLFSPRSTDQSTATAAVGYETDAPPLRRLAHGW